MIRVVDCYGDEDLGKLVGLIIAGAKDNTDIGRLIRRLFLGIDEYRALEEQDMQEKQNV